MNIEEWLGQDNQLGCDIWQKKYCYEGESFDRWLERISGGNDFVGGLSGAVLNTVFFMGL